MIYLDYNATTPVAAEVARALADATEMLWGNPSSTHPPGRQAREAVEHARGEVAALIGASPAEIVFTSGGTESNNAALIGVLEARAAERRHLVTSVVEHPAVEVTCRYLESRGFEVSRVAVDGSGRVRPGDVESALRDDTALVSVMHAQNETGVIQPIEEIARAAHARGALMHTDAAQTIGKLPVAVDAFAVDLLTIAGHKFYGPKGVGALYVRAGTACARYMHGASHESGRRAGTEATPMVVALGRACELARGELAGRIEHLTSLRDRLEAKLRERFPDLVVHGADAERLPNTLSVALPGVAAARLVETVQGVACATGSACDAGRIEPSATLTAMGVPAELALSTLRLTVGRPTTPDEVDRAVDLLAEGSRNPFSAQ